MKPDWKGVFPAVTTQLHADQTLDLEATARHIEVLLEPDEKPSVMRMAIEAVRGRVPVLSSVAECSTAAACWY